MTRQPLTLHEAARAVGVCDATATRLIKAGRLRAYRVGSGPKAQYRVPVDAIDQFIASQQVVPVTDHVPTLGREPVEDDTFR